MSIPVSRTKIAILFFFWRIFIPLKYGSLTIGCGDPTAQDGFRIKPLKARCGGCGMTGLEFDESNPYNADGFSSEADSNSDLR